jgi:hypothetical protein
MPEAQAGQTQAQARHVACTGRLATGARTPAGQGRAVQPVAVAYTLERLVDEEVARISRPIENRRPAYGVVKLCAVVLLR